MPEINVDDAAVDQQSAEIGRRIKAVRQAQRRTIDDVAEASGITKGFLSKIERGISSASVAALVRVSSALEVPLASLFENSSRRTILRAGHYPSISFGGFDLGESLLTPSSEQRMQVILSNLGPDGDSGPELYPLPSEVEFVFVVEGAVQIKFADGVEVLRRGDALTFDPQSPHGFRTAPGALSAVVLWVLCPGLGAPGSVSNPPVQRPTGKSKDRKHPPTDQDSHA